MRRELSVEVGQRIGRGVVLQADVPVHVRGGGEATRPGALLRCDCGTLYTAQVKHLVPNSQGRINNQSCGCLKADHIRSVRGAGRPAPKTHGMSAHQLYRTWDLMLRRCEEPTNHKYPRYGGRGIEVCDRWHDVRQFVEDIEGELGPRPPRHTLDRVDNDGNYEPGNVRWATPRQQAANKPRQGVSQHPGVNYTKGKGWTTRVHLGCFKTEEEAAAVYQRAIEVLEREGILS